MPAVNADWRGIATAVAQVTTVQITGYDAATTYKLTVGGQVVSTVGTGGGVNTTATALAAAWNASTHPYFSTVTAAANTDTVTLTADTAGIPFVVTSSVTGGGGTIGAATTSTANAGPNVFTTPANWTTNLAVVSTDFVTFKNGNIAVLWGLANSAIAPASVIFEQSYVGQVGLYYNKGFITGVTNSTSGTTITYNTSYPEYRDDYLAIGTAILRIGESTPGGTQNSGSPLIKADLGTTDADTFIFNTGRSTDSLPPVQLKNTHANSTLKVFAGTVGVCSEDPADTGQFATITNSGGQLVVGKGVTLATMDHQGGGSVIYTSPSTLRIEAAGVNLAGVGGTIGLVEKRADFDMTGSYAFTLITK
jgi:hypothetical protein